MSDATSDPGRAVARDLLESGAVIVRPDEPFTWASGIRSPIYCDNRVTLSIPAVRGRITAALEHAIHEDNRWPEVVAGVATAGIPQATLLADRLGLPLVYVRSAAKGHGRQNLIEGTLPAGARVVVVEDLISTGGSSLAAVEALREAGAEVVAVLAVFSYGLREAREAFAAAGTDLITLTTLDDLLEEAVANDRMTEAEVAAVRRWREHPAEWEAE